MNIVINNCTILKTHIILFFLELSYSQINIHLFEYNVFISKYSYIMQYIIFICYQQNLLILIPYKQKSFIYTKTTIYGRTNIWLLLTYQIFSIIIFICNFSNCEKSSCTNSKQSKYFEIAKSRIVDK